MILGTIFFLLALLALLPVFLIVIGKFDGSLFDRAESFISSYDSTLLSLGTLFLVSTLAFWSTHLANKSAERREKYNRRIQTSLKMSEFRLKWIEDLREDIASLQAEVMNFGDDDYDFKEIALKFQRIFLMLNPDEQDTVELQKCVHRITQAMKDEDEDKKIDEVKSLHQTSTKILKAEWRRLKSELEDAQLMDL